MNGSRRNPAVLIIAFAISIGVAGVRANAFAATPAISVVLQLVAQSDAAAAGAIVAINLGLFAKEGLAVKIEHIDDGHMGPDDGSAIVIRLQDAHQVLLNRAGGSPAVAFAANYIDSSVTFFFRRDRQIRTPDDLLGKSVGYDPSSDTGLIFEWFLDKNPISRSRLREASNNPGPKQILANALDVLIGHIGVEDVAFQEAGVAIEKLDPRQYGVHALGTVYVANEALIRSRPDVLVRFLRALIAGWDQTYDNPDQAASMIQSLNGEPDKIPSLKRALDQQRQFVRPGGGRFGEIAQYKWSELQTFMLQRRLLKAPLNLKQATNTTIIAEAYRGYQSRPLEK
jgi:NitT/TauT family transport system substrate-binding protein